nr:ccp10 [Clonostachys rosea]
MPALTQTPPTVKVFIAGGCYAGLSAALNLCDLGQGRSPRMSGVEYPHHPDLPEVNFDITIVDERDGYYHLIGSPLAFADSDYAKKAWVRYQDIPALQNYTNIKVLQGSVSSVDPENKTATIVDNATKLPSSHSYDYFVAATGLRRVFPVVPQSLTRKQYLLEAEEQIYSVQNAKDGVVVVGGGAVGIEMAAELKMIKPDVKVTLVHSRAKLLSAEALSDECKDKALELVLEAGVETLLEHRLSSSNKVENPDGTSKYEIEFTNGHKMVASQVVMAISKSVPATGYLPASALNSEGYVKIEANLRLASDTPNAKFHFCGGDAVQWSGIKRCGGAMHMGHYIAHNIHQSVIQERGIKEAKFQELGEIPAMIGLAVGKKTVASGPEGTVSGEDVMQAYFRDDLGWTICWDYMQLGGKKEEKKEEN